MNLDWHTNSIYLWFTSEINEWNIKKSINIIFMSWKPKLAEIETKMPNITKIILINQNSILLNRGFWGGESNQNGKWKHFHNIALIHKYPFHLINSKGTTKKMSHLCGDVCKWKRWKEWWKMRNHIYTVPIVRSTILFFPYHSYCKQKIFYRLTESKCF